MRTLADRVAVVTGAGSGIGRAVAGELVARGCHVALVDLDAAALDATAAALARSGRRVSTHVVDVAARDAMRALPDAVLAEHGRVHVLVNNAGVAIDGRFEDLALEDVQWLVDINLWGVIHGCKFFLPHLRREPEAHIVNVSSLLGLIGVPENSAYCATKFAVRGFSESLAEELAGTGVRVTCVHPGGVRTNIVRRARVRDASRRRALVDDFDRVARMTPETAARRIVAAIERDASRVRLGPETVVADWMKRLAPVTTQWLVGRLYRRAQARLSAARP
jgi:NAD(P)-dependent dehydrogenase (short-subunit alcohol dehydrogenase family)